MIKEYYNVYYKKNKLYVRGLDENGSRVIEEVDYCPTVWVKPEFNLVQWKPLIKEQELNKWKTMIDRHSMVGVKFNSIHDCKQFMNDNKSYVKDDEGNTVVYSKVFTSPDNQFISQYITETFPEIQHIPSTKLKIYSYDIETEVGHRNYDDESKVKVRNVIDKSSMTEQKQHIKEMTITKFETLPNRNKWELYDESTKEWVSYSQHPYRYIGGFPNPQDANEKITLITVKNVNESHVYTFGINEFVNGRDDVTYIKCEDEKELLTKFIEFWSEDYPDIGITWNGSLFDNTYLYNRISKILGKDTANQLSPFGDVRVRDLSNAKRGKFTNDVATNFAGIIDLDYLKVYKKFRLITKENYKLDTIAGDEIGFKKVENPTGGTFKDFYSGEFEVRVKPSEDSHEIRKLGYERTQLFDRLQENPLDGVAQRKYNELDSKIKQMCHQVFTEYNIRDVELLDKLDAKLKYIDLVLNIAFMAHCNPEDVFSPVKTWDYCIYYYLNKDNLVIPQKKQVTKTEKFVGAYVKPPLIGKHEYCESFDLDSLYP